MGFRFVFESVDISFEIARYTYRKIVCNTNAKWSIYVCIYKNVVDGIFNHYDKRWYL